jgi:hypothetical protein
VTLSDGPAEHINADICEAQNELHSRVCELAKGFEGLTARVAMVENKWEEVQV